MAKLSSINKNNRRRKLVKSCAGRLARLKAVADDATKPDEEVADKGAAGSEDDVEVADDDVEVADDEAEDLAETSDFDLDDSDANVMSDSSEEIETGPASSLDDIDAFDIDEEEEPKPKKKKK